MSRKLGAAFVGALFALEVPGSPHERVQQLTLVSTINILGAVGVSAYKDLIFIGQPPNASGGGSVAIFDIQKPANPVRLGETPRFAGVGLDESHAIEIGGRVVLALSLTGAASSRGLKLFDISDVSQPVEVGSYDPGPGLLGGVIHFDVADIPDGRILAFLSAAGSEAATSNFGVRPGLGDLQIVDISDPSNPTLIGEWGVLDEPALGRTFFEREQRGVRKTRFGERVFINRDADRAYYAYSDHGVIILDITDPSHPAFLRHVGFDAGEEGEAFDVRTAHGDKVLIRSHLARFPFQIRLASSAYADVRTAGEASDTPAIYAVPGHEIFGHVTFLGRGCPLDSYLADPTGSIGLMTTGGCTLQQKIARAQLAGATAAIFYTDGPATGPVLQSPPGAVGRIVSVPDGTTLTIAIPVMSVDPNTGRCLGQLRDEAGALTATSCFAVSPVTVTATSIFQGYGRLQIFDIRDPANPVRLSTFGTPNSNDVNIALSERFVTPLRFFTANFIEVTGKTLLAGWESDGLRMIDISQPEAPVEIGAWNGEGTAPGSPPVRGWQVVSHRNLILLNSLFSGVHILTSNHRR